jgi:hypothetical protein
MSVSVDPPPSRATNLHALEPLLSSKARDPFITCLSSSRYFLTYKKALAKWRTVALELSNMDQFLPVTNENCQKHWTLVIGQAYVLQPPNAYSCHGFRQLPVCTLIVSTVPRASASQHVGRVQKQVN